MGRPCRDTARPAFLLPPSELKRSTHSSSTGREERDGSTRRQDETTSRRVRLLFHRSPLLCLPFPLPSVSESAARTRTAKERPSRATAIARQGLAVGAAVQTGFLQSHFPLRLVPSPSEPVLSPADPNSCSNGAADARGGAPEDCKSRLAEQWERQTESSGRENQAMSFTLSLSLSFSLSLSCHFTKRLSLHLSDAR